MEQDSHPYSYKQAEHLKSRKAIESVFQQNNIVRVRQIKLIYSIEPADSFSYQVAFVAPKKLHHFAVDRNRNKRLMREAFRLNRQALVNALSGKQIKLSFLIVAQNTEPLTFAEMQTRIRQLLANLSEKVSKNCTNS